MSIASPTLRSSSSTVPGPSLSRSPISMRARPSTAETCTGTSNTASRSAATRDTGPSGSAIGGASTCASPPSRFGSGTFGSSAILRSPELVVAGHEQFVSAGARLRRVRLPRCGGCHFRRRRRAGARLAAGEIASGADVAVDGFADCLVGGGRIAVDAAVGPFDAAIAWRDVGLGEHDQAPLETAGAGDLVEPFLSGGVERVIDAHDDMRRGDELVKALARQRGNFGERLACDQGRCKFPRHRNCDLDCLAFKPLLDRGERDAGGGDARSDAFERGRDPAIGFDFGVALRLRIAAAKARGFGFGALLVVLGERDHRLNRLARSAGEIGIEHEFLAWRRHPYRLNRSALLRHAISRSRFRPWRRDPWRG